MTICDVCKSVERPTTRVGLTLQLPRVRRGPSCSFDLCDTCASTAPASVLRAGLIKIVKATEVPDKES